MYQSIYEKKKAKLFKHTLLWIKKVNINFFYILNIKLLDFVIYLFFYIKKKMIVDNFISPYT